MSMKKEFPNKNFQRIEAGHGFEISLIRSDSFEVTVDASEDGFRNIEIKQEGDKLWLMYSPSIFSLKNLLPGWYLPRATVKMPRLGGLYINGATRAKLEGFDSNGKLEIKLSGASQLEGEVKAGEAEIKAEAASEVRLKGVFKKLKLELESGSKVQMEGWTEELEAEAKGVSQIALDKMVCKQAKVKLENASQAELRVEEVLNVKLNGASELKYTGSPCFNEVEIKGSSSLSKS